MKILVAISLAVAAIVAAVMIYRAEPDTLDQRLKAEQAREREMKNPSPSVVLSINPAQSSPMMRAANAPTMTPMGQEYAKARSLKPLYDRLKAPDGTNTGEAKFYLYKILATCGNVSGVERPGPGGKDQAQARRDLEAMIPPSSPDREKRLALFDQVGARCSGLEGLTATKADLDKLLADAARDGDPKAQARLAVPQATVATDTAPHLNITDDQFRALQAAIASRDPEAITIAGMALSNTFDDAVLQVGPDHALLSGNASFEAWRLVACEYGMECGADNPFLQNACIYTGRCAANTVQDQIFYYNVSPYDAQLIDQYRQVFRNAVANNDWSGLNLARQPNTSGSRFSFSAWP
ncbi:MAG: hypothetical protein WA190_12770 [Usitatibacter sp.]